MEHKIQRLEQASVDSNVMDTVMRANPRRYMRYAQVQAKYLGWCRDNSLDGDQPCSLLNFLAHGRSNLGWSLQTLLNYRSAVLDRFENRMEVINFWPLRTFFQAIQESSIRAANSRPIDIQPIVDHLT